MADTKRDEKSTSNKDDATANRATPTTAEDRKVAVEEVDLKSAQQKQDEATRIQRAKDAVQGTARVEEGATLTDPRVMEGPLYEKTDNSVHPHAFGIRTLEDEEVDRIQALAEKQHNVGISATAVDDINATGGVDADRRNEIREARGQDALSTEEMVEQGRANPVAGRREDAPDLPTEGQKHMSERKDQAIDGA